MPSPPRLLTAFRFICLDQCMSIVQMDQVCQSDVTESNSEIFLPRQDRIVNFKLPVNHATSSGANRVWLLAPQSALE
ncbi:hypothetical protein P692DRAFT_20825262 [Suillus brevipes Sb2]|nr:hypothetical protein P692DRAFT_20825262 [Suillus brevipes Sb2]